MNELFIGMYVAVHVACFPARGSVPSDILSGTAANKPPPDFLRYSAKAGEVAHLGIRRGAGGAVCALAEPPKRAKRDGLQQRLRLVPDQKRHHLLQRTQLAWKDINHIISENYSLYAPSQMALNRN